VIDAAERRRWTLASEAAALSHAVTCMRAGSRAALRSAVSRLDVETAPAWHRAHIAKRAANELLDEAARHCFADPVAATDVVRWNHLRRQVDEALRLLEEEPAAFGALRQHAVDAPRRLPQPVAPAWDQFRAAAETWLHVHEGGAWTPPDTFPPPPAEPGRPTLSAPADRHPVARTRVGPVEAAFPHAPDFRPRGLSR